MKREYRDAHHDFRTPHEDYPGHDYDQDAYKAYDRGYVGGRCGYTQDAHCE